MNERTYRRRDKGFTLIEIIVVIACIALLAGILAPMVFKNIQDARIARAKSDVKSLATAVAQFYADVGEWPARGDDGTPNSIYVLYSTDDGATQVIPPGAYMPDNEDQADALYDHLIENNQSYPDWDGRIGWNGTYAEADSLDPWGNSYLIYVLGFWYPTVDPTTDFTKVWLLSAGPDGIMQTYADEENISVNSDDIGIRIK
ncbi:prepilin-type N-terminal cleavage/methylation domain-containing protein [bacterium]|nr:prepilin-type N-terminal cleavage/methylation domain-containing protein [candidate division CSSED10-310 bacterium]